MFVSVSVSVDRGARSPRSQAGRYARFLLALLLVIGSPFHGRVSLLCRSARTVPFPLQSLCLRRWDHAEISDHEKFNLESSASAPRFLRVPGTVTSVRVQFLYPAAIKLCPVRWGTSFVNVIRDRLRMERFALFCFCSLLNNYTCC